MLRMNPVLSVTNVSMSVDEKTLLESGLTDGGHVWNFRRHLPTAAGAVAVGLEEEEGVEVEEVEEEEEEELEEVEAEPW